MNNLLIKKNEKSTYNKRVREADIGSKKMFQAYVELRSFGLVFDDHVESKHTIPNQYTATSRQGHVIFTMPNYCKSFSNGGCD